MSGWTPSEPGSRRLRPSAFTSAASLRRASTELSRAAGVSKRTLYQRFGSKDGLDHSRRTSPSICPSTGCSLRRSTASSADPRAQLEAFFAQLEPILGSPDFRGCPFTNAASELPDPTHPAHAVVRRHKERVRRWLRERAKAAGARDPGTLSRQLMLVFAGAQAEALIEQSGRPARDAQRLAAELIEAQIG